MSCALLFLPKVEDNNSIHLVPRRIVERSKGGDIRLGHKELSSVVDVSMLITHIVDILEQHLLGEMQQNRNTSSVGSC